MSPLNNKTSDINTNSDKKLKTLNQLKNISLNIESNEILNNTKNIENKKNNMNNIIQNNHEKGKISHASGFPKIITNQGERIIVSSHPVYHRYKFINVNQNLLSLNKRIKNIYGNLKDNKTLLNNNNNKNNKDDIESYINKNIEKK